MRKICPQCQGSFDTQLLCPGCGIQLLDVPDRSAIITGVAADERFHPMSVGRQILAGLLLAQGLYYALHEFGTVFAPGPDNAGLPSSADHVMLTVLQVIGVVLGGFVVGAGNSRAVVAGAGIGVLNAV